MKIQFAWVELFGRLEPKCLTEQPGPLTNILVDDGGQRFLDTIPWLDEGLRLVALVKGGGADGATWGREAWSADLTKREARIYSLYDEHCFQVIDIDSFDMVLTGWRSFIQSAPDPARHEEIDVPE